MAGEDGLVQVHLLGLPLQARARFDQHLQELTRELSLVRIGAQRRPEATLSPRLLQIAAEMGTTYAAFRVEPDAVVDAALAAGQDFCDVTYTVPASAGSFLQRLGEVLEEADDFCRGEQHLLSLPASEEVVAYRRWVVAESARQLAGQAPRPWRPLPSSTHPAAPAPAAMAPAVPRQGVERSAGPGGGPARDEPGEAVGQPLIMQSMASSVAAARRYVRTVLRQLGTEEFEEAAELGVSELVTNAVLHARTVFTLSVRSTADGGVRIEVTDSSPTPLQPRHFSMTSTTGRGLQLVASVSSDWGVDELPADLGPGKTVWFEPRGPGAELGSTQHDWALDLDGLL